MGIIKLKIVNGKGEEVPMEDLTPVGIEMLEGELNRLQEAIDEHFLNEMEE